MIDYQYVTCDDCGGRGVDPSCCGAGKLVAPETIEAITRKYAGRADHARNDALDQHRRYYEERGSKCG